MHCSHAVRRANKAADYLWGQEWDWILWDVDTFQRAINAVHGGSIEQAKTLVEEFGAFIFSLISYGLGTVGDRYINTLIKINLACQNIHGVGIQLVFGHYIYMMNRQPCSLAGDRMLVHILKAHGESIHEKARQTARAKTSTRHAAPEPDEAVDDSER